MKFKISFFTIFAFSALFFSCQNMNTDSNQLDDERNYLLKEDIKDNKLIIYQLLPRLFGNKKQTNKTWGTLEENGCGKFNDITDTALAQIKKMGITHVYYTGIIKHATLTDYTKFDILNDDPDIVKGRAGSPYAVKDYYDVDPDLAENVRARMQEFEEMVARTHRAKLKVIIDFVPNHVARAYHSDNKPFNVKDLGEKDDKSKSFSASNNFYYFPGQSFVVPKNPNIPNLNLQRQDDKFHEFPAKATGNDQMNPNPTIDDWYETIKLNYGVNFQDGGSKHFDPVPDTWIKMRDILIFWAKKNIDGFRCDMAEMVPIEFWAWVIPQVLEVNKEIIFIAEIYNPAQYKNYLEKGKFNFLYDKVALYDTLKAVIQGRANADEISVCWQNIQGINSNMLRFIENHDEQRIASRDFAGQAIKGAPMMVVASTLNSGPIMLYSGQEVGEPGHGHEGFSGDDGRTTIFDYWGVPEHQKWMNDGKFNDEKLSPEQKKLRSFYSNLLNTCRNNEAIRSGKLLDLQHLNKNQKDYDSTTVYSYLRYTRMQKLLIVVNFDIKPKKIVIRIPAGLWVETGLSENKKYILRDLLSDKKLDEVQFREGVNADLAPLSGYIFEVK